MSWPFVVLLACAVLVLIGAEWPRLTAKTGPLRRRERERARTKARLSVVPREPADETEEFAASVERDLSQLPTIEERDGRRR